MANSVVFAHLMEEHGNLETELEKGDQPLDGRRKSQDKKQAKFDDEVGPKKTDAALMQMEERNTGAVTWGTYHKYLRFAGTVAWAPFILFLLTLSQVAQGMFKRNLLETRLAFSPLIQLEIICSWGFGRRVAYQDLHKEAIWPFMPR